MQVIGWWRKMWQRTQRRYTQQRRNASRNNQTILSVSMTRLRRLQSTAKGAAKCAEDKLGRKKIMLRVSTNMQTCVLKHCVNIAVALGASAAAANARWSAGW